MDAAVLDEVLAGSEGLAVAADDLARPAADHVDVATQQAVLLAAEDRDAIAGHAADGASGDQAAAREKLGSVGESCKGCHRKFREKKP